MDRTARVFVYGTLLTPAKRRGVLGRAVAAAPAMLVGYERRDGHWPYIVPSAEGRVPGEILEGLATSDLAALDRYEAAVPTIVAGKRRRLYARTLLPVLAAHGSELRCWVYLPNLADWLAKWQ